MISRYLKPIATFNVGIIKKTLKTDNYTITNKYRFVSFGRVVQYVVEVAVSRGVFEINNLAIR